MPEKKNGSEEQPQRVSKRIDVSLPLLVRGHDIHGQSFEDSTHSFNVSREGASFLTRRELRLDQQVELVIPQRSTARPLGSQTDFVTTAAVRRIVSKSPGEWEVGVHFTGPRLRTFMSESA